MSEGTTRLGVVFVHGLFSSETTWDPLAQLLESDQELAASITVRRFGYASPKLRSFRPDRRTPDYDDLAERLKAFLFYEASEHDRVVLVAHSQGGLIVQRYLARMIGEGRGQELTKIQSVLLFACPNDGSDFLLSLRSVWLSKHPQVRALKPLDPGVKDAQRTVLNKIVQAAPGTVEPSSCHIPFWVFGGLQDNIVVRASAEGVFPNVSMLPGDHSTIIQPASHQAPAYVALRKHLRDAQQQKEPAAPTTTAPEPASGESPPGPWGDSAKAARILDVLPPYADWLKTLRTQDFFVVSGRINRLFHEAADAFKTDRLEFIDPELREAATACSNAVMELSGAMIDLLFADRVDTPTAEKLPGEAREDAWTFVLGEHQRGKDELRLHMLRDAFFEAYDILMGLLNERLFVPQQTATPATVADRRAVPDAGDPQRRVGQGLTRHERELSVAYDQLRTAGLGAPTSEAYLSGAAAVQHFAAAAGSGPGWVLSLRKRRAIAVSEPLWAALEDAGRPAGDDDPLAAVGYPTAAGTDPTVLGPDVSRVVLEGGNWGPGLLVSAEHGWRWEPQVALDFNQTRSATNWTATQTAPQLRIRVVVTLPWDNAPDSVTTTHRRDLTDQLPFSPLAGAVTTLSLRRAADLPAAHWILGPHRNALDSLSYSADITTADAQPALSAAVMASLSGTQQPTVTCAEFLIQNAAAWSALLPAGTSTKLALEEVESVLLAAWETAADLLPAATCDVATMRWAGAPTVELRLSAEGPHDQPRAHLGTLIDLSELGSTDRSSLPEMAVTITVSPMLERTERQRLLQRALVHMVQGFGFVEADDRLFT